MDKAQIYGLLMLAGTDAKQIAEELGCSDDLVWAVVAGTRGTGPQARAVRQRIAEATRVPEHELWDA